MFKGPIRRMGLKCLREEKAKSARIPESNLSKVFREHNHLALEHWAYSTAKILSETN